MKINKIETKLNNLNVLHVSKLYYPWTGGVERNVQELAESIKNKVKLNVLCCQNKGKTKKEEINGVNVWKACSLGIFFSTPLSPCFPFYFRRFAKSADLIHYHMLFPLAEFMEVILNPHKKKVATLHYEKFRKSYLRIIYRPLLQIFLKRMDKIIIPSKTFLDSKLLSKFKEKIEVIPFAINTKNFTLDSEKEKLKEEIKKKYGFPIILFIGNLLPYKGLEYLINAMKNVRGKLLLIGDGYLKDQLLNLTARNGLEGKVHFLGRKRYDELASYYHACDIFVLPSTYESFGLVQLEAMACGKPVINTKIPTAVPEISIHEETGLTVMPNDSTELSSAINRLIENEDERIRFGINAKERVEKFYSIETVSEKILSLYMALI